MATIIIFSPSFLYSSLSLPYLKSGIPLLVLIPAPVIIIIFLCFIFARSWASFSMVSSAPLSPCLARWLKNLVPTLGERRMLMAERVGSWAGFSFRRSFDGLSYSICDRLCSVACGCGLTKEADEEYCMCLFTRGESESTSTSGKALVTE